MEAKGWLSSHQLENGDTVYAFTAEGENVLGSHDLMRSRAAEAN